MRRGADLPRVGLDTPLREALIEVSRKGFGMTVIVDGEDRVVGVFTDGDLRRALDRQIDVHGTVVRSVMTSPCRTIEPQALAAEAVRLMQQFRITALPVVQDGKLVGLFNVHDLLRAGVM